MQSEKTPSAAPAQRSKPARISTVLGRARLSVETCAPQLQNLPVESTEGSIATQKARSHTVCTGDPGAVSQSTRQ